MDGANANNEALISSTGAETKKHRPVSLLLWIQRILFVWSDWRVPGARWRWLHTAAIVNLFVVRTYAKEIFYTYFFPIVFQIFIL